MTAPPAPEVPDGVTLEDDGAVHAFYAWLERHRVDVDLEDVIALRQVIARFDTDPTS